MTPTTPKAAQAFLHTLFRALFDPSVSSADVGQYFTPDYQQQVDGKILNFAEFIAHVEALKSTLISGTVTFERVLVNGPHWADIHYVDAVKRDGRPLRVKVLAFYTLTHGKISRIDELTHMEVGDEADRDLGSR